MTTTDEKKITNHLKNLNSMDYKKLHKQLSKGIIDLVNNSKMYVPITRADRKFPCFYFRLRFK